MTVFMRQLKCINRCVLNVYVKVKINNIFLFQPVNDVILDIIVKLALFLCLIYIFFISAVINCMLN